MRGHTMTTTHPTIHPDIPIPAGAVHVYGRYDTDTPTPARYFRGSSWLIERDNRATHIRLQVDGTQHQDGTVTRSVVLDDDDLTPQQARQLARALIAAADEVEQMSEYDRW